MSSYFPWASRDDGLSWGVESWIRKYQSEEKIIETVKRQTLMTSHGTIFTYIEIEKAPNIFSSDDTDLKKTEKEWTRTLKSLIFQIIYIHENSDDTEWMRRK